MHSPDQAIAAFWAAWVASWIVASLWSARTQKRPPLGSEVLYRILTVIGFFLVLGVGRNGVWIRPLDWQVPPLVGWQLVVATAAGFALCWWARIHLGRLWSGAVTRKEGHRVVDTGPYAVVRHPIYTGIIVSALATAIERRTWIGFVGVAAFALGFYIKARLEERFLRAELGKGAYDAYAQRTAMLVPFVRF